MAFAFVYPLVDAFLTILWIFLFVVWIWILFAIISDLFRDHEQSGWAKAIWVILLFMFPLFGVLAYLIVRGGGMHLRAAQRQQAAEEHFRDYVRQASGGGGAGGGGSTADELEKLAGLRDRGVITPEEYERQKAKILA